MRCDARRKDIPELFVLNNELHQVLRGTADPEIYSQKMH